MAPALIQYTAALLWLSNVSWKVPTDFGRRGDECRSLCGYVEAGIDHPVLPGSAWLFEHVISPNLTLFGWSTVFIEGALAAMLLSGTFLRVAGVLGIAQSAGILLAVANAPDEWYWSYFLMIALHVALLAVAPQLRPISIRRGALLAIGYGAVVVLAHRAAGFGGDGNKEFSLFAQRNDFPGDWGRNVFPGSIALGLLFAALGVGLLVAAPRLSGQLTRSIGAALGAVSVVLVLTYRSDGTLIGLGTRTSSVAVLAAVALSLIVAPPQSTPAQR